MADDVCIEVLEVIEDSQVVVEVIEDAATVVEVLETAVEVIEVFEGPEGKPGKDGEGGLKVYASLTEAENVRTAEVGTLHVDSMSAAFPNLAAVGSGVERFFGTGPGDLVITTTYVDSVFGTPADVLTLHQEFAVGYGVPYDNTRPGEFVLIHRTFTTKVGMNAAGYLWWPAPAGMPVSTSAGEVPISRANGSVLEWVLTQPTNIVQPQSIVERDVSGNFEVAQPPTADGHPAPKSYVDAAIAAIPDPTLPARLGGYAAVTTNWNETITNGWWMGSDVVGAPAGGWFMGLVTAHNERFVKQELTDFDQLAPKTWVRYMNNLVWSPWAVDAPPTPPVYQAPTQIVRTVATGESPLLDNTWPGLIQADGGSYIRFYHYPASYIITNIGVTPGNVVLQENGGRVLKGPLVIPPGATFFADVTPDGWVHITPHDGMAIRKDIRISGGPNGVGTANAGQVIWGNDPVPADIALLSPGTTALVEPIVLWPISGATFNLTNVYRGPTVVTTDNPVRLDCVFDKWVVEPLVTPTLPDAEMKFVGDQDLPANVQTTVDFGTVVRLVGGMTWNSTTKRLTVPVAGTYLMNVTLHKKDNNSGTATGLGFSPSNVSGQEQIWYGHGSGGRGGYIYTVVVALTAAQEIGMAIHVDQGNVIFDSGHFTLTKIA